MNIHVKPPHTSSPWASPPADFAVGDVPLEEDHDEPYDRCPFCNAAIAGIAALAVGVGLLLSWYALAALVASL